MGVPSITLEACRVNAKMGQAEWAEAIGVSKNTVYNWENGRSEPTASQLRLISERSNIPMEFIFVPMKSK